SDVARPLQHLSLSLAMLCGDSEPWGLIMIGNVVSDGRLLSLRATEWLMLVAGGVTGLLILMF
ncbi:MAG: hypothetical protein ACLPXW_00860, partial [Xanthobacteraceae bacterium]